MTNLERYTASHTIIEKRWHNRDWTVIANTLDSTPKAIRELRLTAEYENQVWADYGRAAYCFCKHRTYEHCILHLTHFYGIPKALARQVLGKDWKEPEQKATQLTIAF